MCQSGHVGGARGMGRLTTNPASSACNDAHTSWQPASLKRAVFEACFNHAHLSAPVPLQSWPAPAPTCSSGMWDSQRVQPKAKQPAQIVHHPGSAGDASDGATRQVSMPPATQQEQGRAPTHSTAHQTASSSYSTRKSARVRGCMRRCASFCRAASRAAVAASACCATNASSCRCAARAAAAARRPRHPRQ